MELVGGGCGDAGEDGGFAVRPVVGGGEVPVGPYLGKLAGLAEHDRHIGPAHRVLGQAVGDDGGADAVELEDLRVAVLDDQRAPGQGGEVAQGVVELAAGETRDQVGQRLAFHGRDQAAVERDAVVAAGQRSGGGAHGLAVEPVGVALVGVDDDLQGGDPGGPGGRGADRGAGLLAHPGCLPEHGVAASGGGEHDLGAVLAGPVEVDGGAPPATGPQPDPFDDLWVVGPVLELERVAVEGLGARPGARGAEHQAGAERHPEQVRQP
jgi:hypothetical protein